MRADRLSVDGCRLGCEAMPCEPGRSRVAEGAIALFRLSDAPRLDSEYLRRPLPWPLCIYQCKSLMRVSKQIT